jgi:hypothetical protein
MQDYPMRERIYLPVVRFGVPHTDWKYVFFLTFAGFVLPFVFRITVYGVPAPMLTGVATLALAVAFFNFIRIGRRPFWFQHTLRALFSSPVRRAALPADDLNEPWVKAGEGEEGSEFVPVFHFQQ